jgi:predicted negative regulator of RcsB-dependent stress response
VYETDQEQIEAIKSWWNQNGNWVIGGFIAFILAYSGYYVYESSVREHKLAGSAIYDELMGLEDSDTETRQTLIAQLKNDYDDLTYSVLASMDEAKGAVEADDLDSALTELSWAEKHADSTLLPVVQYRKAQVLYGKNELDKALSVLSAIKGDGHQALTLELKGDVLLAQGKLDEARTAYQQAFDSSTKQNINNPYLKMKVDDLAQAVE